MALVKYNPAIVKPRKSSTGFTFSNTTRMHVAKPVTKIVHQRSQVQRPFKGNFINLAQHWRNLSAGEKTAWQNFATAIPQPTKFDPTKFLSGYHCFLRRNFYNALDLIIPGNIMTNPNSTIYEYDSPAITAILDGQSLGLSIVFERGNDDLQFHIFASEPVYNSVSFCGNNYRYMKTISNVNQIVDITEPYLSAFQKLPARIMDSAGIFVDFVECAKLNGQFWFHTSIKPKKFKLKFGLYYRSDIVHYSKSIAASGWRIPSLNDFIAICSVFGSPYSQSPALRAIGEEYWYYFGIDATNLTKLSFIGSGVYYPTTNAFEGIRSLCEINFSSNAVPGYFDCAQFYSETYDIDIFSRTIQENVPLRVCRTNMNMSDGEKGSYVGNDGKVYQTVCWAHIEMITSNLVETKFSNGSDIPVVTNSADFISSVVPCGCYKDFTPET